MSYILALLKDPNVPGNKVGHVKTPGPLNGTCAGTGEELTYQPTFYEVIEVAKDLNAAREAGWFKVAPEPVRLEPKPEVQKYEQPIKKPAEKKPENCPECGGNRKGRGYQHKDGCKLDSRNNIAKSKEKCPECGGLKRGRGFSHTPTCKLSVKKTVRRRS